MSGNSVSQFDSTSSRSTSLESSSKEDHGILCLGAAATPYQEESLATLSESGDAVRRRDDWENKDGLSRQSLVDRYEGRSRLDEW